jgi:hypothetical protein
MADGNDPGVSPVPLLLSALLGLIIAILGAFAIVSAGTAVPNETVKKPLISYDSP